ncbi:hypothetical protein, partial [Acetobacter malorum]|uniref:hypothetical protein n=1 Tax=Acetobacter malorum TaxID=178901 RepID=UPI0039E7B042
MYGKEGVHGEEQDSPPDQFANQRTQRVRWVARVAPFNFITLQNIYSFLCLGQYNNLKNNY